MKFGTIGGLICSGVGGYVIWKDWKKNTDPFFERFPSRLEDKVYLVTGANSGQSS